MTGTLTSRRRATAIAAGAAVLGLACAAPAPAAVSGGAVPAAAPVLDKVGCRGGCVAIDRARTGSVVQITGSGLDGAKQVVFLGGKGRRDDVSARVAAPRPGAIEVVVPARARTGPVRVIAFEGQRSKATRSRLHIVRRTPKRIPRLQARADRRRVFVGSKAKPSVSYFVGGERPAAVLVAVVPVGSQEPVAAWPAGVVSPGTVASAEWDGLVAGVPAPEGLYEFRIVAATDQTTGAAAAQAEPPSARTRFRIVAHTFPIAGPHTYGEGAGRYGAGRGDSSHQGQDVFAACGTPLVAAMAGKVKHVAFHERAGHYVVIAADDGFDHVYMHLKKRSPLVKDARVATGDAVGLVGDTGRASGCHLHFELWKAPGWYTGGSPVDPLPVLKSWE